MTKVNQNNSGHIDGDMVGGNKIINNTILHNSLDYQKLIESIEEQKKLLKYIPKDGISERIKVSKKLNQLEKQLNDFKENVIRLYEMFNKIELNSERLKQAKAHFDKGEFREADAILKAEEMTKDLNKLIEKDQELDKQKEEVQKGREQIADEFMIKAELWQTFYHESDWFEKTVSFYEKALFAFRSADNLFDYALFLEKYNFLREAMLFYEKALEEYKKAPHLYLSNISTTLNNLGTLQRRTKNLRQANNSFEETLKTRRKLAEKNPEIYLPKVATTLNNLGNLQKDKGEFKQADKSYEEALKIRRELAEKNPEIYLSKVATTLNNIGVLQVKTQKIELALETFEEALTIQIMLVNQGFDCLSDMILSMINLSIFYLYDKPNKLKSINLVMRAMDKILELPQTLSFQNHMKTGLKVLEAWKES